MYRSFSASLAFAFAAPLAALAQSPAEIQALREEIGAIRSAYEARLQALEQRLQLAQQATNTGPPLPVPATPLALAPLVAAAPAPVASPVAAASGNPNAFNPAISLILSGLYSRSAQDPARYAISGFATPVGAGVGPGTRGLGLAESELGLSASIDPWLRGAASIALHPDDSVSVEEAFVQTTALGNGLSLKAGRFLSGVGYLNAKHAHAWDFVDNPLVYQALLGTQYGDDGVQLQWLAPTDQYLELGAELARGRGFPASATGRNGAGMTALTLHTGGDIGASHTWRAGISLLNARATDQGLDAVNAAGARVVNGFSGSTRVWVLDGIWKWAPSGNATRSSFKLQGEYLRSSSSGSLAYDLDHGATVDSYRATQSGWYLQGVYQFMPRWRLGLRTDRLDPGMPDYGINAAAMTGSGYRPARNTLMLDFNPSEFSRLRLQLARDRAREGHSDNHLFLQYQMSLGAHGAHGY